MRQKAGIVNSQKPQIRKKSAPTRCNGVAFGV